LWSIIKEVKMYYAVMNASGVCRGVSQLASEVSDPRLIEIPSFDPTLIGKRLVAGEWVVDSIWADQQAALEAANLAMDQAISTNLPSWSAVDGAVTAISNLAEAKTFIRKLARVVYWLAKKTEA
jgi:hypothetical protein